MNRFQKILPVVVAVVAAASLVEVFSFLPAEYQVPDGAKLLVPAVLAILIAGLMAYNQRKVASAKRVIEATGAEIGATYDAFPDTPPLYGRERDFSRLRGYLVSKKPPVIQLIGKSGIGKTALVAAVVRKLKRAYVRVEIERESADAVAARLFEIYTGEKPPQKSFADIVALVVTAWQESGGLLVLDNLQCLLNADGTPKSDDARLLLKRLGEHGQLIVLSWQGTDALGLGAEHVVKWELKGIGEKPGIEKLRAEKVEGKPEKISLSQVVDNLDGNPKMLEIVGELIRKHGGQVTILDQNLDWVSSAMAPLRAVWEAIGAELQELTAALCVLRRGRNAERLGRFLDRRNVQTQLESLLSWGLAKPLEGVKDYSPDHDLVRRMVREHFGEEKLKELHQRAAELWLLEGKDIGKKETPTRIEEIQPLLEAGYHLGQAGDSERVLWQVVARDCGGLQLHELADRLGAWSELTALLEKLLEPQTDPQVIAFVRHNLGMRWQAVGDWEKALVEYRASLEIKEQIGDVAGAAKSRHQIGMVYQDQGDWEKALVEYRASLEIKEQIGDVAGAAKSRHQIGMVYQDQGNWDKALVEYRASLEITEQIGDVAGVAQTRHQIGMVYQDQGNWDKALVEYRASLEIQEQIGDVAGVAQTRHQIGNVLYLKGDWEKALAEYRASLEIAEKVGDVARVAISRHQIGMVYQKHGNLDKALAEYQASLEIEERLGRQQGIAQSRHQIGIVFQAQGDLDKALVEYRASLEVLEKIGDVAEVAKSRHQIGRVYQDQGDWDKALVEYRASLEIEENIGDVMGAALTRNAMGVMYAGHEQWAQAFAEFQFSYEILSRLGSPDARIVANNLAVLRGIWGAENFDRAWKGQTGGEVPEWVKGEGEV